MFAPIAHTLLNQRCVAEGAASPVIVGADAVRTAQQLAEVRWWTTQTQWALVTGYGDVLAIGKGARVENLLRLWLFVRCFCCTRGGSGGRNAAKVVLLLHDDVGLRDEPHCLQ